MIVINSETVKNAITKTISKHYKDITIYKNEANQGIKSPCFFVSQINTDFTKTHKNKYKLDYIFNVRYHDEKATRSSLEIVAFSLLYSLYNLSNNEFNLKAKNVRHEIVDGVLVIIAVYALDVVEEKKEEIKMEDIEISGGVK